MPDMRQTFPCCSIGIPVVVLLSFILANALYLQLMDARCSRTCKSRLGPCAGVARPAAARRGRVNSVQRGHHPGRRRTSGGSARPLISW